MCGVVSIIYGTINNKIGKESADLLKRLEYRGYDSTGASYISDDGTIIVKKKVGAPSKVVGEFELGSYSARRFIGQVRWATFGAVTDINSQPHHVNCFVNMVGAHNGNIANTDSLKEMLSENGHLVKSDNDGEIIVHLIEHFYSINTMNKTFDLKSYENSFFHLKKHDTSIVLDCSYKTLKLIDAIKKAQSKTKGSYAACVSDPSLPGVFAIKSGSSLYAGLGIDDNGEFIVVSSDLSSVLSKTRLLIPLLEGQGIYFTHNDFIIFSLNENDTTLLKPQLKRSKLNIRDTNLQAKFHYFMEQEIFSESQNIKEILIYYFHNSNHLKIYDIFEKEKKICKELIIDFIKLYSVFDNEHLLLDCKTLIKSIQYAAIKKLVNSVQGQFFNSNSFTNFKSDEKQLLNDIYLLDASLLEDLYLIDTIIIWKKQRKVRYYTEKLHAILKHAVKNGNSIYFVASGTSYHAALTGSYFFNSMANIAVHAVNPGMFRSFYFDSLKEGDIIIGITQSGETKDLIDIFTDVKNAYSSVSCISLVNNENSRIPQELSDFFLPILCGPEIAVAATKSFINQLVILYIIASKFTANDDEVVQKVESIINIIDTSLKVTDKDVAEVALRLHMSPSIHILGTSLIGLAKEAALKIREVVLNHTEGYDAAEFKHGPNTILGKNTIFSLTQMESLFELFIEFIKNEIQLSKNKNYELSSNTISEIFKYLAKNKLGKNISFLSKYEQNILDKKNKTVNNNKKNDDANKNFILAEDIYFRFIQTVSLETLFSNYPLIFICPPDERDKRITIAQIHTHKIRGADTILFAEKDNELLKAVQGRPANDSKYYSKFIELPYTNDKMIFVFSAASVLQNLAFKMSVQKMKALNNIHIENHGVHPDAPKNVSKSITVD